MYWWEWSCLEQWADLDYDRCGESRRTDPSGFVASKTEWITWNRPLTIWWTDGSVSCWINDPQRRSHQSKRRCDNSVSFNFLPESIEYCFNSIDEAENDNRRSIMADGRSEISNASANSRRPTIDSNMSRDRPYLSRDLNLLVAPTGGTFSSRYYWHF